jgi:mono/diheme cytochrome c family protein
MRPRRYHYLAITVAVLAAGEMAGTAAESSRPVSFEADVQPIFDENCVTCHQSNGAPQGLVLEDGKSWQTLLRGRSTESELPLVAPGKPEDSYLFEKLAGTQAKTGSGVQMPVGDPLTPEKIAIIRQWIAAGAANN